MRFFCHVGYMLLFFKIILHFPLFFISFGYTVCSSPNKTESVEPIQCFCCSVQFLPLTVTSVFQFTFPKARVCLVQSNSSTLPLGQIGFVFLSFPPFYLFCSIFFFFPWFSPLANELQLRGKVLFAYVIATSRSWRGIWYHVYFAFCPQLTSILQDRKQSETWVTVYSQFTSIPSSQFHISLTITDTNLTIIVINNNNRELCGYSQWILNFVMIQNEVLVYILSAFIRYLMKPFYCLDTPVTSFLPFSTNP